MYKKNNYFIFDLDGTLAYTIDDLRDSVNYMLEEFGFPTVEYKRALEKINSGARRFVEGCLPPEVVENQDFVDKAFAFYTNYYNEHCMVKTHLYNGVLEGIRILKERNASLAVYSNKGDEQTKKIIYTLFPENTFDIVVGYTGEYPHKPDPSCALSIVKALGAKNPSEVTLVGDSDKDMLTAANAGLQPVGVNWGYRPASLLSELGAKMILKNSDDFRNL